MIDSRRLAISEAVAAKVVVETTQWADHNARFAHVPASPEEIRYRDRRLAWTEIAAPLPKVARLLLAPLPEARAIGAAQCRPSGEARYAGH